MKQFFTLIIAGIIGALSVLGLQDFIVGENFVEPEGYKAIKASNPDFMVPTSTDFVGASKKATKVVVHIYAEESVQSAERRLRNERPSHPFEQLFGEDFFGSEFFGRNFGFNRPQNGTGSGVIVSPEGYIVTNNHVVGFADNIIVTLDDGRKVNAERIGSDPSTDLAVIKINLDERLDVLDYADSDEVEVGEWVLAVGNPFGYLTSTVTAGIVSAKGRDLNIIKGEKAIEEFIQTDAVVNPGNSGGALVNQAGELIGINTAIATPTGIYAGYSFAIPSNMVRRIVNDIIENGDIERVNLGIGGYDVDESVKKEFDLMVNDGFYVSEVQRGSAAQLAGIIPGDVITKINGHNVNGYSDLEEKLKFSKAGDMVDLGINRKGKSQELKVKLRKSL